tara:strand:- start:214 stop:507 length:294 start_codon:yes stop_codon:yes gene_type:complete
MEEEMFSEGNTFHVYSKSDCPFCDKVVEVLREKKREFTVTVMDDAPVRLHELKTAYEWETVPIVIACAPHGEKYFIGGYTDLVTAMEQYEQEQPKEE